MTPNLQGVRVAVAGLGRSGMAAIELLREQGAAVRAIDERPADSLGGSAAKLQSWGVEVSGQTANAFEAVDLIVLSPGVPLDLPQLEAARARGIEIIGEVELASYYLQGPIIGITGSNGKTTTTSLIGHILKESGVAVQVGGNIGTPPTQMINTSLPGQWNVLELSSFQLETIREFRAHIGVGLNVTPDHLDRHKNLERYTAAKARLFETQSADDFAVLNADDAACLLFAEKTRGQTMWFSLAKPVTPGVWFHAGKIYLDSTPVMEASNIPLRGTHNVENAMAAIAATRLAGVSPKAIAGAIQSFPGVEHRLEFVRERNGVEFFNDSKATNVDATAKALDAFDDGLWVILGGKDKDSDYTLLEPKLRKKARSVLLIGAAAGKIRQQLGSRVPIADCGTLEAAVRSAARQATSGETVLLAPACASFDQFDNYEHRGREFKRLVKEL